MESAFGGLESGIWQQMDLAEVKMTELLNMASQLVQALFCETVHSLLSFRGIYFSYACIKPYSSRHASTAVDMQVKVNRRFNSRIWKQAVQHYQ